VNKDLLTRNRLRELASQAVGLTLGSKHGAALSGLLAKVGLRGLGVNVGYELDQSGEAYFIERALKRLPGAVCADVGANVGDFTRLLRRYGSSKVYAFEPVTPTFDELVAHVGSDPAVQALNLAVGEHSGVIRLFVPDSGGRCTLASRDIGITAVPVTSALEVSASMVSLDDFCREREVRFDLVKIDVEGYELEVLQGARRLLADAPPALIQFEFNVHHLHRRQHMGDFAAALDGYRLFRIATRSLRPLDMSHYLSNVFVFQNIAAVHETRRDLIDAFA
jgi:FkbM family methyltransferase